MLLGVVGNRQKLWRISIYLDEQDSNNSHNDNKIKEQWRKKESKE